MNIRWWDEYGDSELQVDYVCIAYIHIRDEEQSLWCMPPDKTFYTWHFVAEENYHLYKWLERKAHDNPSYEAADSLIAAKTAILEHLKEYLTEMTTLITQNANN